MSVDPLVHAAAPISGVLDYTPAEVHGVAALRTLELPRVTVAKPGVGALELLPAHDVLEENPVLVSDAVARAGNAQGRHRVDETRCEPTETAVAKASVVLLVHGLGQRYAAFEQRFVRGVEAAEVQQAVFEQPPEKELHG